MGLKSRGSSTPVQSKITALETKLSALDGLDVGELQKQIADIKSSLDSAVGEDGLAAINKDLDKVKEDLEKILNQQSFTQGPINIRNQAELKYVKSLGEIKNIRGNVTVDVSSKSMYDSIAAVNKIISKITTIVGGNLTTTGHVSGVLDFSALTFVDGDLTVAKKANNLDGLTAVSKDLDLCYPSDYVFPNLASTGSITIKDSDKVKKVDFPSLLTNSNGGTFQTKDDGTSVVNLSKATYVDLGGVQVRDLTAGEAVTVKLGYSGTLAGTTTVTAVKATSISVAATKIGAHLLTIKGKSDGTVDLNGLKEAGAGITVSGAAVNANALKTVTGTLTFGDAKSLTLPALEKADEINATKATKFSAEKLALTSTVSLSAAEEITLASATNTLITPTDKVKTLTLKALALGTTFDASSFDGALETLNVTGIVPKEKDVKENSQTNQVTSDGAAKLKTVTLGGAIGKVTLDNNAALESLTTGGNIIEVSVDNNDKLKTITFGHSFLKGEYANTVEVINNAELTAVDMTAVQKIKTITVTDNAKLASIKVGSPEILAEPGATISYTVKSNKLNGKYTDAIAGTETTQYSPPVIVQADLYAIKLVLDAYNKQKSRGTSATFDLSFDKSLNDKGKYEGPSLVQKLNEDTAAQNGADGDKDTSADRDTNNKTGETHGLDSGFAKELTFLKKE